METLKRSVVHFIMYTVVLGIVHPLVVTVVGQVFFNEQANGSLLKKQRVVIGSKFIGQQFKNDRYFFGRPSATVPEPYNPNSSSGSNLSLTNPALQKAFDERRAALGFTKEEDTTATSDGDAATAVDATAAAAVIPIDLITASGSGLDPEISIAAAKFQIPRVAAARQMAPEKLLRLIDSIAEKRWLGVIGEPRVNVLMLNLELDSL